MGNARYDSLFKLNGQVELQFYNMPENAEIHFI